MSESNKIDSKIIFAAIDFIRVMSAHYGSDEAIKIWEKVCEAIPGKNVKEEVFLHMLGVGTPTDIKVTGVVKSLTNYIYQIKILRNCSGMGLRDAKDAVVENIGYPIVIRTVSSEKYDDACRELRKAGFLLG